MSLWVFGYGSLIWNPEFSYAQTQKARVFGYHRGFCMRSIHHRGTEDDPGLVLALEPQEGAHCDGLAFEVAAGEEERTLDLLRERELVSSAYLETTLMAHFQNGEAVEAVTYVIDCAHVQYEQNTDLETQAQRIAFAHGGRGPNYEYLYNTAGQLAALGLEDGDLSWLVDRVRMIRAEQHLPK